MPRIGTEEGPRVSFGCGAHLLKSLSFARGVSVYIQQNLNCKAASRHRNCS